MNSTPSSSAPNPVASSLRARLLNMLASPGDVFDEVSVAPPRLMNWLAPTLLVCVAGLLVLAVTPSQDRAASAIDQLLSAGRTLSATQSETLTQRWLPTSVAAICLAAFAGTAWAAGVLWLIGRLFLKCRLSFLKTLEIVGLTGMILVLGTIITGLLIAAAGDSAARPALSFFAGNLSRERPFYLLLDSFNLFHLWAITVLAIGFSRLCGVSVKEGAFWVFSYWLFVRLGAIMLA